MEGCFCCSKKQEGYYWRRFRIRWVCFARPPSLEMGRASWRWLPTHWGKFVLYCSTRSRLRESVAVEARHRIGLFDAFASRYWDFAPIQQPEGICLFFRKHQQGTQTRNRFGTLPPAIKWWRHWKNHVITEIKPHLHIESLRNLRDMSYFYYSIDTEANILPDI